MARLIARDLTKSYGNGITPVDSMSFEIEDGGFLTLLGPSGCGKSTILRMIAGLEAITSGEIMIGDRRVNDLHPSARDVAMVFQSYALYPHMTAFENIAVNLRLRKIPAEEIRSRVAETARLLDIEELLNRKPKTLSGGQQQRVALGRAIIRKPKLFLLDEPLSNLDAIMREKMRGELKALFAGLGATVIYVTHDQTEAMSMSSKIVVIDQSKIQQTGTPDEIYNTPATGFVANFVGSPRINMVPAHCIAGGLRVGSGFVPVERERMERLCGEEHILLGVRPENMRISEDGLSGTVQLVEPMGAFNLVDVKVAGERLRLMADPGVIPSGEIKISFDAARLHFFHAKTGKRLA